jgi:hypothetical protein
MSNYVYPTPGLLSFGQRDNLDPLDADKVVKGSQLDIEFNNLVTAIATKLNIDNPTFTGTMNGGIIDGGTF